MQFEDSNLDMENLTLPNDLDEFSLPVFDPRQIPFSPTSPGKRSPGRPRTMKEYEEDLANLKKENFNLKVRIYFLEQHRVDPSLPKDVDELRHLYTNLKVEHELQKKDLEAKENLLLDTYKAFDVQKQEVEAVMEEKQELQCRIENLEKELKDYHQRFMETSVPHLDDTNALYAMTFGLSAKAGPSRIDTLAEDKMVNLQEELSREKERVLMLEDEISVLNSKQVDGEKDAQKLKSQIQEMEENLNKILAERNRYEELYSRVSVQTTKLEKSLRKRVDLLKEKETEAEKFKSLAEELRKQLTRVEYQLQEIQERTSKSHNEKQIRILYTENEKLKHEVKYLQQQLEKRTSRVRDSDQEVELKEAGKQQADLVQEINTLKIKLKKSHNFIQTMYLDNKKHLAQIDELKGTVRKLSGNPTESRKEEVSLDSF